MQVAFWAQKPPPVGVVPPSGSAFLPWHHPPCSSDNPVVHAPRTRHESSHPVAPSPQSASDALSACGALFVSACGSTNPPPASSVVTSPRLPLVHPHPLNAPLPASVRSVPVPSRNTFLESAAAPSAEISLALRDSNLFPRCGALALLLLLLDSAARVSWSAGSSTPTPSPRLPTATSCSSPAPLLLRAEAPSCSSLSSSTRPPLEVAV